MWENIFLKGRFSIKSAFLLYNDKVLIFQGYINVCNDNVSFRKIKKKYSHYDAHILGLA